MKFNKILILTLVLVLSGCATTLKPEDKKFVQELTTATIRPASSVKANYRGPKANLAHLYYDYSDKSHLYPSEIAGINKFITDKGIDIPAMVAEKMKEAFQEKLSIELTDNVENESSDSFRIYSLSLMFLNPHIAGTKVYPVVSFSMNLSKNGGGIVWEGGGTSPTKFAGDERVDLDIWLNDEERCRKAIDMAIDEAVANTITWYKKAL